MVCFVWCRFRFLLKKVSFGKVLMKNASFLRKYLYFCISFSNYLIQIIMTPIFILQLICCTITGMLSLHIAMASLQVRWKERRYEISRWLLCGSMAVFSIHYFLQMTQGFRAQGADVGAVVNIMFYTPVVLPSPYPSSIWRAQEASCVAIVCVVRLPMR